MSFHPTVTEYPTFATIVCTSCEYNLTVREAGSSLSVTGNAKFEARKHVRESGHVVTIDKNTIYRVEPVAPKGI